MATQLNSLCTSESDDEMLILGDSDTESTDLTMPPVAITMAESPRSSRQRTYYFVVVACCLVGMTGLASVFYYLTIVATSNTETQTVSP